MKNGFYTPSMMVVTFTTKNKMLMREEAYGIITSSSVKMPGCCHAKWIFFNKNSSLIYTQGL